MVDTNETVKDCHHVEYTLTKNGSYNQHLGSRFDNAIRVATRFQMKDRKNVWSITRTPCRVKGCANYNVTN